MGARVRAMVSLAVVMSAAMLVSGCGHYVCHTTFGSSTCTPPGGGIGGGGKTGSPVAFAFFADDNNGKIGAALLDSLGNFNLISNFTSPTFSPAIDGGMVVIQKKWLYMPLSSLRIVGYSINPTTGALTALPGSPYTTSDSFSMTSDPAGKFLFVGGDTLNTISVFQINQTDGSLIEIAGSPFSTSGVITPWQAATDGLGKFLYVAAGPFSHSVAAYAIDGSTGALSLVAGSPFPYNMSEVKGELTGKFLFGVTGQSGVNGTPIDDHIYVFNIDQTSGAISPLTGSPFVTLYAPINITVHPNGKLLYTFNESAAGQTSPMEGFQINTSTGALTPVSNLTSFAMPEGMFDQSGAYLFTHPVASLTALSANGTTGALANVANVGIGSNFGWAVVDVH
jgi:6-phosphogluconolactonase (cycloisomerase 2 family)